MTQRIVSYIAAIVILLAMSANAVRDRSDAGLAQIRKQFRDYHLQQSAQNPLRLELLRFDRGAGGTLADLKPVIEKQNADGSWPDISYKNDDRSGWLTAVHASRIAMLSAAWAVAASNDPDRARCAAAVHSAFAYWKTNDFQCPNWWYNRIGIPKTLGTAAILLGDELKPVERSYLINKVLPRAGLDMTGQNRVWLAGITLMRAMLLDDAHLARRASDVIWDELRFAGKEGIQRDYSFHQHGPQQQFGNYGLAFAGDMTKWITILRGSPFAADPAKIAILRNYLDEGIAWTLWNGKMDASCIGRQYNVDSLADHGRSALAALSRFDAFDGVTNRTAPLGSRVYWQSDFLIHRRPDFMATLKMSSSRVIGAESLNGENLSGYHTADGVLLLTRTGDEYENIFPLWDWRLLPGTTALRTAAPVPAFSHVQLPTDIAGGLGDGTNAIAALDIDRDGLTARKAWFFTGDQILCLGAGITSTNPDPVVTTVNQCWHHGEIKTDGDATLHDGIRYLPLGETSIIPHTGIVTGSWLTVRNTSTTPRDPVTGDLLTLTIDHGIRPQDATYAYAILPGTESALQWHVEQNTPAIQAIADDHSNLLIAFHEPGNIRADGHSLTADQPCLVIVNYSERPHLIAADPTHKLGVLHLSWDGQYHHLLTPRGEPGNATSKDW